MCKLDLEKVYDRVNWEFLDYMFGRFGFGMKWRKWMKKCYRSAHFSILVNSTVVEHFHASRGLDKGILYPLFFFLLWLRHSGLFCLRHFWEDC